MPFFYYDAPYLLLVIISLVLGGATQAYINATYTKWSKVRGTIGMTGAQVARRMLDDGGAQDVGITRVAGHLTDYYDPRDNMLHLSDENFEGASVASMAVACHEAGHAVQTARGYVPGKIRTALVPVVNFSQQTWMIVLLLGVMLNFLGLVQLAIILFAFSVVFQLVTLPVEIDASRRAVAYLSKAGLSLDETGARKVLTAAALTYVAAALVSVLQLLYLYGRTDRD
ncbi:MAG: zinc metallopeptidase [Atopobiaceae bacterium]|jgi:Zn-dependent membrane protease YugP